MRIAFALGSVAAVVAATACGSSDTELGSEPPSSYEKYVADLAGLVCVQGRSCCTSAFSASTCKTLLTALADRPREGKYVFHADLAEQCLDETRATGSGCSDEAPAVCGLVVTGLIAPGAPCRSHLECESPGPGIRGWCDERDDGYHCRQANPLGEACAGTCFEDGCLYTSEGQPPGAFCYASQGLYCGADGTCEAHEILGAPCGHGEVCADGLMCGDFECVPVPALGEPCSYSDCAEENFCNQGICAPKLPIASPCASYVECESEICEGGVCQENESTPLLCAFGGASG